MKLTPPPEMTGARLERRNKFVNYILDRLEAFRKINSGPYLIDPYRFGGIYEVELQSDPDMRMKVFLTITKKHCPYVFDIPKDLYQPDQNTFNENWLQDCISTVDDGTDYVYAKLHDRIEGVDRLAISKCNTATMLRLADWNLWGTTDENS